MGRSYSSSFSYPQGSKYVAHGSKIGISFVVVRLAYIEPSVVCTELPAD